MIKSVVREHKWSPTIIGDLFIDCQDYQGLEYWYQDVLKVSNEIKERTRSRK
jgi:hypothetical protein